MHQKPDYPRDLGLFMPPEWHPHAATWMAWPFGEEIWFDSLAEVRAECGAFIRQLLNFEPVHLIVNSLEAERSAHRQLGDWTGLTYHRMPLNDVWMRDNGPSFLISHDAYTCSGSTPQTPRMVHWRFNAWGGKYDYELDAAIPQLISEKYGWQRFAADCIMEGGALEVNGKGQCITTEQCLLTDTRHAQPDKAVLETYLSRYLGINHVIWLKGGLEGDHTDGHVDTITRFADPYTVLTSMTEDKDDPNYAAMQENWEILERNRGVAGLDLELIALPLPKNRYELADGTRLPATYANFYRANGAVLVPQYQDPHDEVALKVLREVFKKEKVIGLSSRHIIKGGGSFHCLTQQQPR